MNSTRMARKLRHKKKMYLDGLNLLFFLAASFIYMEVLLRMHTREPFFNVGLLYAVVFAVTAALGIYILGSFFQRRGRQIFTGISLFFTILMFGSQLIYYDIFKTFYTVYSAGKGGQVLEFMDDILFNLGKNSLWILALLLPLAAFILLSRKSAGNYSYTWLDRGVIAGLLVAFFALGMLGIHLGNREVNSPYDLYYQNNYPVYSVNQLGLVTSMRIDLQRTIFGFEPTLAPPLPVVDNPPTDETPTGETPGDATPGGETPVAPPVREYNVVNIDFDRLIAEAPNDTMKAMHEYFKQREPTAKNDYTGLFEGYNLILITAEGYSHYAVDKDVTPTLYKMTHEGFNFTNFYNPIWGVSTSDGEYVATTGLIPKPGVWSMYKSSYIDMRYAMGNMLRPLGYKTMAYHNHTYTYYERHLSHPNLGYEYKGLGNGLNVRPTWPESDLEMMELTVDDYIDHEPFHAYYMTVSGHMRYDFNGNYIAYKNRDLVADLPYAEGGRAYMATQIELDLALEHLLERLEEAGVAERTLIAISADHYPYGLDKKDLDELAGHTVEENFELYKSSLILYAKGMTPETIDRPISSLDKIPTIMNLLGLEFDSRLLMGVDIFSDADPVVIFVNRSFITDKGKYNAMTRKPIPNDGEVMDEDYRRRISEEIDRKFFYSAMILDTDYFKLVLDTVE